MLCSDSYAPTSHPLPGCAGQGDQTLHSLVGLCGLHKLKVLLSGPQEEAVLLQWLWDQQDFTCWQRLFWNFP